MPKARPSRLWVYDRPITRDPLWLIAVTVGILGDLLFLMVGASSLSSSAVGLNLASGFVGAIVFVGTAGGIVREFRRGRRSRTGEMQPTDTRSEV